MQVTIPDLEVMLPVVKERRRLNSIRPVRTPKDIIDGNLTDDGYTYRTIKDDDVLKTPLHYLWAEYESALLVPVEKVDLCKCIMMHNLRTGDYGNYSFDKLLKLSYEQVSHTYWLTRTTAKMYYNAGDEDMPHWKDLVKDFDAIKSKEGVEDV